MANNIAPELLKKVQERYAELLKKNTVIKSLDAKIEKGKATYRDADMYAAEVGDMLAEAYKVITGAELPEGRLLYDIANAVLRPTLTENYEIVSDMATKVQKALNEEAGLNLNAVKPSLDDNRVQGIIDKVAEAENFDDIAWMLQAPVRNFAQNVVDEAVRANADFHAKVGLSPKIVRIAEPAHMASYFKRGKNGKQYGPYFQMEPCKWCLDLVGTYDYFDVRDTGNDVFRRHENCKCIVEYIPGNGKRQNVHNKGWQDINATEVKERAALANKIVEKNETVEASLKNALAEAYEWRRVANNIAEAAYEEIKDTDVIKVELPNIGAKAKEQLAKTISGLAREYDTPLTSIIEIPRERTLGTNIFATTNINYSVNSAVIKMNPLKTSNFEAMVDRLTELRQTRFIPKIRDELIGDYLGTHEFAHTLLNMEVPLKKSTNFVGLDYDKLKKARKEIQAVFKEYVDEVGNLEKAFKDAEFKIIIGESSDLQAAQLLQAKLDEVLISKYSRVNPDEFLAEAFTEYRLGENPSKYSKRVGEIIDRYFKR